MYKGKYPNLENKEGKDFGMTSISRTSREKVGREFIKFPLLLM